MGIVSILALSVIASQCQLSQRESLWQGNRKQVLKAGALAPERVSQLPVIPAPAPLSADG